MSDSTPVTPAPGTGADDQDPRTQTGADATAGDAGLVEDPDIAAPEEGTQP